MVGTAEILFGVGVALLALIGVSALRNRILGVMAVRNALRRRRQSVMVVAGLMVGTAIVSGALVASDSLDQSVRQATYESFGEIDETVVLEGYNFFPEYVADELASEPGLSAVAEGVAPQAIWDGAVTNPRTDLYEPGVRLIGFDPERDRPFGPFEGPGGSFWGDELGARDVILTQALADRLDARAGDTVQVNYSRPVDPVLPTLLPLEGTVTGAGSGVAGLGDTSAEPYVRQVTVEPNAVGLLAGVGWADGQADLDLVVTGPDGTVTADRDGAAGSPDSPATVSINGTIVDPLPRGTWEVRVEAKAAAQTSFQGYVVVLYAEYDLAKIQERLDALDNASLPFEMEELSRPQRDSVELTVARITDGGKGLQFREPGTMFLRLDALQGLLGRDGQVNIVRVTNPGGVEEGPATAHVVYPAVWAALNETKEAHPDVGAVQALTAINDKVFWLQIADETGELFTLFLGFVGSFSVIAGLLLILNIFTMLADERKAELAISRAVGMRRKHLVRLFLYEGTLYAVVAGIIGVFFGLGLAAALIWAFNNVFTGLGFPQIPFQLEVTSLLLAFAIGLLLTLATIWLAARRSSRLNIVRAIRRLDDPEILRDRRTFWVALVLLVVGSLATVYGLATAEFATQVTGPILLAVGLGLALRRHFTRRAVYPLVAAGLLAYLTATNFFIDEYDQTTGNYFGPVRAIAMAACLAVMLLYNEKGTRAAAWLLARIKPFRAVALPATAYPLHKKFRTGMTLLMFAVILLMVSLFSIFGGLFEVDPSRESGGYHIRGDSTQDVTTLEGHGSDPDALAGVEHYDVLPYFFRFGGDLITVSGQQTGQFGPPQDTVWGIDEAFAERNEFRLVFRHPDYPTDEAAYQAVAQRDDVAIVSYHYSTSQQGEDFAHDVGETVAVAARGSTQEFTIVGIQEQFHFKGVFVRQDLVGRLFTNTDTTFLFTLDEGEDAGATAKRIEAAYRDIGMDAVDLHAEVIEEQQQFRNLLQMVQVFLGLGLVVGIVSLGIVTARNVVERRQEIGMLRALGYTRADVRRTFLIEMLTTVTLGILIGTIVALLVSYGLWVALLQDFDRPYVVPWVELAIIAAIAYVATTLATLAPIRRAARTPPAEALRYIE